MSLPSKNLFVRDRFTWLAYLMLAFFAFFQNSLGPIMPSLQAELGLNYTTASLHFSAFALGMMIAGSIGDALARRFGRPLLFWGGGMSLAAAALAFVLSPHAILTITWCFTMGLLGTLMLVIVQATLSDRHGQWRTVALTESVLAASVIVGITPILVGLFERTEVGWRGVLIAAALGLGLVVVAFRKEPLPQSRQILSESARFGSGLKAQFWAYWVVILFVDAVEFCMIYWGSSFFRSIGLGEANASAVMSVFVLGLVLGRLAGSRLTRRLDDRFVLLASFAIALTGFPLFWLAPVVWMNVAGMFAVGLGISNLFPIAASSAMSSVGDHSDAASARITLVVGLATFIFPFALGLTADQLGIGSAYGLVVAFLLAALVASVVAERAATSKA